MQTSARTKTWIQGLCFLLNAAAVGGCRPRAFRDPSRLFGSGVRGLSVPLMLLASYLAAKLSFASATQHKILGTVAEDHGSCQGGRVNLLGVFCPPK